MKKRNIVVAAILILAVSVACFLPFRVQLSSAFIATAVAGTMQARQAEIPLAPPLLPLLASATPPPTATLSPKSTENPDPCYQALLVSETVHDGSVLDAGETFAKSWVLRNTGSCTWNPKYRLVFSGGDQMSGPDSVLLNEYVAPGGLAEFHMNLKAPGKANTYTGYWRMKADNGVRFARVFTRIEVEAAPAAIVPTKTPTPEPVLTITDYQVSVTQDSHANCPVNLTVSIEVTVDGPGDVEIEPDSADFMGCDPWKGFLTFGAAGTQTVDFTCSGASSGPFEIAFIIAAWPGPTYDYYGPQEYTVDCTIL